jgi:hypothetical protein
MDIVLKKRMDGFSYLLTTLFLQVTICSQEFDLGVYWQELIL